MARTAIHREELPLGLVVEGFSEYYAVPVLLKTLNVRSATPAVFHGQADEMNASALARRMLPVVRAQLRKGIRKLLIILDRESRPTCAPSLAETVRDEVVRRLSEREVAVRCTIAVVCADRKLENWLLADPYGIAGHKLIRDEVRKKQPENVDGTDGKAELRRYFVHGKFYVEGQMTGSLAFHVRVENNIVLRRSRSLRKLVTEAKP